MQAALPSIRLMRPAELTILASLAPYSRLTADQWSLVVAEVEKAGSIAETRGTARHEIDAAISQRSRLEKHPGHASQQSHAGGRGRSGSAGGGAGASGGPSGRGRGSSGTSDEMKRPGTSNGGAKTPRQSYDRSRLSPAAQGHYDDFRAGGLDHESAMQSARRQERLGGK